MGTSQPYLLISPVSSTPEETVEEVPLESPPCVPLAEELPELVQAAAESAKAAAMAADKIRFILLTMIHPFCLFQ